MPMKNVQELRDALGLNDLGGADKPRQQTQQQVRQAPEKKHGSNALRSVTSSPTSGGGRQVVPSTSPLNSPLPISVPAYISSTPRRVSSSAPIGTSGSSSSMPISDLLPDLALSPDSYFLHDDQQDTIGDSDVNNAYVDWAVENGYLSGDDAWAIMHRPTSIDAEKEMRTTRNISPDIYADKGWVVDDGSSYDYAHMTSDKMTGSQYKKYIEELGLDGMPLDEIVPEKTYSKRQQFNEYGFEPFTPDWSTYLDMVVKNAVDVPGRLGSFVSNLRDPAVNKLLPDYMITYDPEGTTISGLDFDKKSQPYMGTIRQNKEIDPFMYARPPQRKKIGGGPTPIIREYVVPDLKGMDTYHYGDLSKVYDEDNGTYTLEFTDGSSVRVDDEYIKSVTNENNKISIESKRVPVTEAGGSVPRNYELLNDEEEMQRLADEYGGSPIDYASVLYIPDLILSDGTRMSYDDVERLYYDKSWKDEADDKSDDDIRYGFSKIDPLGLFSNKPQRLMNQEPFSIDENGIKFDTTDALDNVLDWTLGSLPISLGRVLPWVYALSSGATALQGVDPMSYDPATGTYNMTAGSYDDDGNFVYGVTDANGNIDERQSKDAKVWGALGNAAVPLTENIAGNIGSDPLKNLLVGPKPDNPTIGEVLKHAGIGALGEGYEEVIGNIFEDWTRYGPRGLFANQLVDEYGNPMYDDAGYEIRDYNTPLMSRIGNFANGEDLLNAFAGGVGVDAMMGLLPFGWDFFKAARRNKMLRDMDINRYVEPMEVEKRSLDGSPLLDGFDTEI